jgi:hypothetical protein
MTLANVREEEEENGKGKEDYCKHDPSTPGVERAVAIIAVAVAVAAAVPARC